MKELIERLEHWSELALTPYELAQDLGEAADALERHRWIPVSERLPEERGRYLVFVRPNVELYEPYAMTGFFYGADEDPECANTWDDEQNGVDVVTHWMSLPPVPDELG